jgi:hypothetical protein
MRQKYTYSCGATCINILERAIIASNESYSSYASTPEEEIMRLCGAKPGVGIGSDALVRCIKENRVLSTALGAVGERKYNGGVAIINIKNARSGGGHYVIVLKMETEVSYIDPIVGQVEQKHISEIDWESGDGKKQWALNIEVRDEDRLFDLIEMDEIWVDMMLIRNPNLNEKMRDIVINRGIWLVKFIAFDLGFIEDSGFFWQEKLALLN